MNNEQVFNHLREGIYNFISEHSGLEANKVKDFLNGKYEPNTIEFLTMCKNMSISYKDFPKELQTVNV